MSGRKGMPEVKRLPGRIAGDAKCLHDGGVRFHGPQRRPVCPDCATPFARRDGKAYCWALGRDESRCVLGAGHSSACLFVGWEKLGSWVADAPPERPSAAMGG